MDVKGEEPSTLKIEILERSSILAKILFRNQTFHPKKSHENETEANMMLCFLEAQRN